MNKEKELILEELKIKKSELQEKAQKNVVIQNIKLLGQIELKQNREESEIEENTANLYLVEEYNTETDQIIFKYYADNEFIGIENNGEVIPTGFAREKYEESDSKIRDVLESLKEKEEVQKSLPGTEKESVQKIYDLNELEEEKKQEEKGKDEKKESEQEKSSVIGKKPKGVIQRINPHKTYVNSIETVSNAVEISSDVDELVIADTQDGDENALSDDKTIYMVDKEGEIIEESNGKKINELFEYDDATGENPMYDDNTKIELGGYAERNKSQTMARFKSKEDPDLYLSVEQKKMGQYNQVYAEQKTRDGNDTVGIELETDNSEIQTNFKSQKVNDYGSGDYKKEYIDKEADMHEEHGDDVEKMAIENVDGDILTKANCESPFVPDTNITWEQFSKSVGNKEINELIKEFFKEYEKNHNGQEVILKIQADYKEKEDNELVENKSIQEEYQGRVPWDSTKH